MATSLLDVGRLALIFLLSHGAEIMGAIPSFTCPQYKSVNSDLDCRCTAPPTLDPGVSVTFRWLDGVSNTATLRVNNVQPSQNGTRYTCEMNMDGDLSTVDYILQVAYGPGAGNVAITGPRPLIIDGVNSVTLTCEVTNTHPLTFLRYTWTNVTCSESTFPFDKRTCTFVPTSADQSKNVGCEVRNPLVQTPTGNPRVQASFPLNGETTTTTTTTTATTTTITTPQATSTEATTTPRPPVTTVPARTTPTVTVPLLPVTTPDKAATTNSAVVTQPISGESTTDEGGVTGSTVVPPATAIAEFPVAAFAGGLGGAFLLILIIIIIAVVCRKRKDREELLQNRGDNPDGSYKHTTAKDFYAFENNGYDHKDMKEIHPANGNPPLSRPPDQPQRALGVGYPSGPGQSTQEASVTLTDERLPEPETKVVVPEDPLPPEPKTVHFGPASSIGKVNNPPPSLLDDLPPPPHPSAVVSAQGGAAFGDDDVTHGGAVYSVVDKSPANKMVEVSGPKSVNFSASEPTGTGLGESFANPGYMGDGTDVYIPERRTDEQAASLSFDSE